MLIAATMEVSIKYLSYELIIYKFSFTSSVLLSYLIGNARYFAFDTSNLGIVNFFTHCEEITLLLAITGSGRKICIRRLCILAIVVYT